MRLLSIFLIFSILMGRKNHTEIHKRIFEKYYSNKPNVCYFLKTIDSYFFDFFLKLLVFCSLVRLMLSGDIELNPGLHLENLIEYSSYLKNRGTSLSPLFFLINFQSLKNKFEEFSNFLQTAPINTFVAVTETWLDTDCNIKNNFLTASHTFFGKCRSDKTGASKGGGVGIFVPKKYTADIKLSIEIVDESFFESICVEITDPLTEKLLVNFSYCPNKRLGEYFLDQLSTNLSGAYSVTDNVILLGDYNLNYLNKTEKK